MKKNKNFIISILILVLVFIAFIILMKIREKNLVIVSSIYEKNNLVSMSEIMQDKAYIIQNIKEDNESYLLDVYYPKASSNDLNSYIDIKIQKYISDFKKKISYKLENNVSNEKYYLKIKFDVESDEAYLSFVFNIEENSGFIHPDKYILTVNYDKRSDKVITIDDILLMYPGFLYNVSDYCYTQLKENKDIKKYGAYDVLKVGTQPLKQNYERFCLGKKHLTIYFEVYQIAPYVLGSFELRVPVSIIKK